MTTMSSVRGIGPEQVERGERHEPADGEAHVATAHADGLGDALALRREEHRHLLQSRAGRRYHPDAPARDEIGKAERDAAEIGGAAIRAHHEPPSPGGELLEGHFVLDRHVVAPDHHVKPAGERAARLGRGPGAGHGDQGEVGVGHPAQRAVDGAGRVAAAVLSSRAPGGEELLGPRPRALRRAGRRVDHDDEIVRARRRGLGGEQAPPARGARGWRAWP